MIWKKNWGDLMDGQNQSFIRYLNSLHSASGDNQNSYAESNITSPFFAKTSVPRKVGDYIAKSLLLDEPKLLILTGHAGDGKTSLLLQVLLQWGVIREGEPLNSDGRFLLPNGRFCTYVKDFSEDVADVQQQKLKRYVDCVRSGESVFLVANTGPLIATFEAVFSRQLQTQLVNAIDRNDAQVERYDGVPVSVLNAATIDNSTFVKPFLDKILAEELWEPCTGCKKADSCPIYNNARLVRKACHRVSAFIQNHYIWMQEHDRKFTIRQIVAHLAYSITGDMDCEDVAIQATEHSKSKYLFTMLFSNLFFGYRGFDVDSRSAMLASVRAIMSESYDRTRLQADEKLFVVEDYQSFLPEVRTILSEIRENHGQTPANWQAAVRRTFILFDTDTDEGRSENLLRDVYSVCFPRYLRIRQGAKPDPKDKALILSALQMLFMGAGAGNKSVKITLMRSSGLTQSVQLVLDELKSGKFSLVPEEVSDFDESAHRYRLVMDVKGKRIAEITLPMLNYFYEISQGAIATNLDPLLSHGIDSIKAQLISVCEMNDTQLVLATTGAEKEVQAEYDPDSAVWILQ